MYNTHVLKNGLKIVTENRPDQQVAHVYLAVGVGSMHEDNDEQGLAHFLEHVIFSGTEKRPTEDAVWESVEELGGTLNAFTTKDYTSVFCSVLGKFVEQGIEIVADMVLNPIFPEDAIEQEKKIVASEILKSNAGIANAMHRSLVETLFDKHPVRKEILGDKKSIGGFNREKITSFHAKHYVPSNMALAIVGPVDHGKVIQAAERYFAADGTSPKLEIPPAAALSSMKTKSIKVHGKQGGLAVGMITPDIGSADFATLSLLGHGIGTMSTFGLRNIIRFRQGLAYTVKSGWNGYVSGSYMMTFVRCEPKNLDEIVKDCEEFFGVLGAEVLNPKTFDRVRNNFLGTFIEGLDSSSMEAKRLSYLQLIDAMHLKDVAELVSKVTPEDVQRVTMEHLAKYAIVQAIPK